MLAKLALEKPNFVRQDDTSVFNGIIESTFVKTKASNGKNFNSSVLVGVICRPPHGQVPCFNDYMSKMVK